MSPDAAKPYWVDEMVPKHEAYHYGERDTRMAQVAVDSRMINLIVPDYEPEFEPRFVRMAEDTLVTAGVVIPDADDEEDWNEEGYGTFLIARRCRDREATFWTLVAHEAYPETMGFLDGSGQAGPTSEETPADIEVVTPRAGGNDG
jgi:hypothetical protein